MTRRLATAAGAALVLLPAMLITGCELPPIQVEESPGAYYGLGMEQVYNPQRLEDIQASVDANSLTLVQAQDLPGATTNWENVQIEALDELGPAGFTTFMTAITRWVSPVEGCNYCHVVEADSVNLVSDDIYTKVVSRNMILMTQAINTRWREHVGENGITCYTCHRGNPNPIDEQGNLAYWYFTDENQAERRYLDRNDYLVQSNVAYPQLSDNRTSIKQTEMTYSLMLTMSDAMGVNCTYCHNSARFGSWDESLPQRAVAQVGLDMVQFLNNEYMLPLQDEWPQELLGPLGDGPKINCTTCHQGLPFPVFGLATAENWPVLLTEIPQTEGIPVMDAPAAEEDAPEEVPVAPGSE